MRRSDRIKKLKAKDDASNPEEGSSNDNEANPVKDGGGGDNGREAASVLSHQLESSTSEAGVATAMVNNPLENPVILRHLFQLCDGKLLANCRLVSKQWYQESLLTWRKDFPITVSKNPQDNHRLVLFRRDVIRRRVVNLRTPLHEFLAYCADPKNDCDRKPYRFLKLLKCKLSVNPEQFGQLWDAVGSHLTTLHLTECRFQEVEEFRNLIFTACPNLQTLKMDDCFFPELEGAPMEELEYEEPLYGKHLHLKNLQLGPIGNAHLWRSSLQIPISWLELFSHFQSLTNLSIELDFYFSGKKKKDEVRRMMEAIRTVRNQDPKALPFKGVEIDPAPDISKCELPPQQRSGRVFRLPLQALRFKVKSDTNEAAVKNALEYYAKTVRKMEVTTPRLNWIGEEDDDDAPVALAILAQPFPFGVMLEALTTLEIYQELCGTLTFLKYTPNLERLGIDGDGSPGTEIISNSCQQEMANVRMINLVEFKLDAVVTDQDLACLLGWMPNITSLKMTLNDRQFAIVCRSWKNLTKLWNYGRELTDVGVTGIEDLGGEEATRPNIGDLQGLEEFTFYSNLLTDASVFQGFLKLPHLQEINFRSRGLGWGEDARKALSQRKIKLALFGCQGCCRRPGRR